MPEIVPAANPRNSRRDLLVLTAVLGAAATAMGIFGFLLLNLTIVPYDDEGYMMAIVQGMKDGGALYEGVYSQYGPLFSLIWLGVSEPLPGLLSHDGTRIAVLVLWLSSSLLLAVSVFRLSRSVLFSLVTFLAAFQVLRCLIGEPLHPLSLIALFLSSMVFVGTFFTPDRARQISAALGALIGGLLMIKLNLGLLAAAALVVTMILRNPPGEKRWQWMTLAFLILVTLSPLALMAFDLDLPWVRNFGLVVVLSLLSIAVIAYPRSGNDGRPNRTGIGLPVVPAVVAGLATVLAVLLITLALGTSPSGLVDGIVLEPLALRETFALPFFTPWLPVAIASVSLVASAVLRWAPECPLAVSQALRILGGSAVIWFVVEPALGGKIESNLNGLTLALPLAWIALIETSADRQRTGLPGPGLSALFLTVLAVFASVHLYPVAGNQVGVSSFLLVAVGAVAISRACSGGGTGGRLAGRPVAFVLAALAGLAIIVQISIKDLVQQLPSLANLYRGNPSLELAGAGLVHPAQSSAAELEAVSDTLQRNCDTYYSIPGLNRFYFLAELPLASGPSPGAWPWLFDSAQQQQVVEDLQAKKTRRVCILTNDSVLETGWGAGKPPASGPLVEYLSRDRRLIDSIGPYEIFLKLGEQSPGPDLNR